MQTHEPGAVPPVVGTDDGQLTLVVSVDTDAELLAGDVVGPDGVAAFSGIPELLQILQRATHAR